MLDGYPQPYTIATRLADGVWTGNLAIHWRKVGEITVEGRPLRDEPYRTRTPAATDYRLSKKFGEMLAVARDPEKLATVARTAPVPWGQRLGYLLEHLGFDEKARALKEYVRANAKKSTALLPKAPHKRSQRNQSWKLYVNTKVEREL